MTTMTTSTDGRTRDLDVRNEKPVEMRSGILLLVLEKRHDAVGVHEDQKQNRTKKQMINDVTADTTKFLVGTERGRRYHTVENSWEGAGKVPVVVSHKQLFGASVQLQTVQHGIWGISSCSLTAGL